MARFEVQVDSKTYFIDTELEARVQALEAAVLALQEKAGAEVSAEISANLEASKAFFTSLEEALTKAAALEVEVKAALQAEGKEVTAEAVSLKLAELHMAQEQST